MRETATAATVSGLSASTAPRRSVSSGRGAAVERSLLNRDDDDEDEPSSGDEPRRKKAGRQEVIVTVRTDPLGLLAARNAGKATSLNLTTPERTASAQGAASMGMEDRAAMGQSARREVCCACCCWKTTMAQCKGRRACVFAAMATLVAVVACVVVVVLLSMMFRVGSPSGEEVEYVRIKHVATNRNATGETVQITYENISWEEFLTRKGFKMCVTDK